MNIRIKVSDKDRRWIENQEENYIKALENEYKRHEEAISDIRNRLDAYRSFWATNEKPIRKYEKRNGGPGFYETEIVYALMSGSININTLKTEHEWICKFCRQRPAAKYCGASDSRYDETFYTCDCDGAKAHGRPWEELEV